MKSNLISIIARITIFVLVMNFASCKVLKQNESTDIASNTNNPLMVFLNCSISYDSIAQEYEMDLIDKTITEGRIKQTTVNSVAYDQGDFRYCLLNKNNQVISFFYMPNPLDKTIEYVDDNGLLGKMSIRLDSTQFSLRIPLEPDSEFISFERETKQLLLVDLNK